MHRITQKCFQIIPVVEVALKSRHISALYITGDKASENYVTLQPYMDFKQTFQCIEELKHSIETRKMPIDLKRVMEMYSVYQEGVNAILKVEEERDILTKQLKELSKVAQKDEDLINQLKDKGKHLRSNLKSMKTDFYSVEDEFVQSFLHLPNTLHKQCPKGDHERVLYRSQQEKLAAEKSHLDYDDFIYFIEESRYYLLNEAADFDVNCPQALAKYFLEKGSFIQTANPDFTRGVLLEANATPMDQYHEVMETHLQNKINPAYLTGGGSFESVLGAVTKLCVYPNVLPLRYVSCGRIYERTNSNHTPNIFTATQNNAVQTFVATRDLEGAEEEMENILNLCVDFYKIFNVHFRIVYVNAAQLTPAESLRAQIEIYSPHEKRYVCVGRVSNYKNFVSKRILFTMRQQKDYHFLNLVGGPVLYTSRLIAALIEHGEVLNSEKVVKALNFKASSSDTLKNATDEFKSLFK